MPLVVRAAAAETTTSDAPIATATCGPKDTAPPCERLVAANPNLTTIPVVLGVVIPLSIAFVVLVILHRRHVRRLRQEDAEDRNKSLDFGMDDAALPEKKKKKKRGKSGHKHPEMSAADAQHTAHKDRGLSMDLSMTNPYLLPPELQGSRESLHSLSRSIHNGDDKYRATNFIPDDGSIRSPSSLHHHDNASIYTYSSRQRTDTDSMRGLLPNVHSQLHEPLPSVHKATTRPRDHSANHLAPFSQDPMRESFVSTTSSNGNIAAMRASNNYLGQFISGGANGRGVQDKDSNATVAELDNTTRGTGIQEPPSVALRDASSKRTSVVPSAAGFDFGIPPNTYELSSGNHPTIPQLDITPAESTAVEIYEAPGHEVQSLPEPKHTPVNEPRVLSAIHQSDKPVEQENMPPVNSLSHYEDESDYYDEEDGDGLGAKGNRDTLGYDPRRSIMGLRPLPPDDPAENSEQRAIRIRSFYKEYFDETTKPGGEKARLSYFDGSENYIDDYYGSSEQPAYGHESYTYSAYGYASRGPSSVSGMSGRGVSGRHRATISNGSYMSAAYAPRSYSSASGRLPVPRPRYAPKKKLPPPSPLPILPTPSMLKDDSMLPNAADFAPPQVFKNQRAGTPDSLRGGMRPYSPSAKAYNPLVSSFDDLSVLPSPHQLSKTETLTSLDFAPPRFAAPATASDSGSIRSNRSGMSAMQLHHIRSGAYRLSRIPKDIAGTKDELAQALKPQWNAR